MARVSLGHDQPPHKIRIENTSQASKNITGLVGLAGGKPTVSLSLAAGNLTGKMVGIADEEVRNVLNNSDILTKESCSPGPRSRP